MFEDGWPWWMIPATLAVGLVLATGIIRRASRTVHQESRTRGGFVVGMMGVLVLIFAVTGGLVVALVGPPALHGATTFSPMPGPCLAVGIVFAIACIVVRASA